MGWKENGEIVKETDITKCCRGSNCATKCDKHYSGRGYLQTTYYKNYKDASEAGCTKDFNGNSVDIVKNPELVEDDEVLAWCTAAVYWKKNVHGDRCPNGSKSCNTGKYNFCHQRCIGVWRGQCSQGTGSKALLLLQ